MKSFFKALGAVAIIYLGVMAVLSMQHLFDRSDLKKAAQVVYDFVPPGVQEGTLAQIMAKDLDLKTIDELSCQTTLLSRYEGHVLVTCQQHFEWVVDVVRFSVSARNQSAQNLIARAAESFSEESHVSQTPQD